MEYLNTTGDISPDELQEAIDETQDKIDELELEIDELEGKEEVEAIQDEIENLNLELSELEQIKSWSGECILIHEDSFENHAMSIIEDDCNIDLSSWPTNCIDIDQAASELKNDYTTIEIDDVTFYCR